MFNQIFFLENNKVVEKPIQLASLSTKLVDKSVSFIKNIESRPFLLYHSFAHVHTPLATEKRFRGVSQHGRYGDVIAEVKIKLFRVYGSITKLEATYSLMLESGDSWTPSARLGPRRTPWCTSPLTTAGTSRRSGSRADTTGCSGVARVTVPWRGA